MLRLSAEQLAILGERRRSDFLDELEATALAETPGAASALGPGGLRPTLDAAVGRAQEFGVLEREPIERVVLIALESEGAVWEGDGGWGLDILTDARLSGLSKALALEWRALVRRRALRG
jgi:hypothetical protein